MTKEAKSFVELLAEQLDHLKDDDTGYTHLRVYVAGDPEPFEFRWEDDFFLDRQNNVLVVREGPVRRLKNAGIPETIILLSAVAAAELG